jgi:hypothetical protein
MTSTPISYDVVKVSELEAIGRLLNGNDELIVNDLLEAPTETKRCRVIDFAESIKQYILPIASETVLGGVKIGEGLTINPSTGVLTNDVVTFDNLNDVTITSAEANHVIVYDGNNDIWVNSPAPQLFVEMFGGDGIEITGKGSNTEVINVKPGQGITITNDEVTADLGSGLRIINDKIEARLNLPLYFDAGAISLSVVPPAYIEANGSLSFAYGLGLRLDENNALEVDPNLVLFKNPQGNLAVSGNLIVNGSGAFSGGVTTSTLNATDGVFSGNVNVGGSLSANSGNFTNDITANGISLSANLSAVNGNFTNNVSVVGSVSANSGNFVDGDFTGDVTIVGDVSANTCTFTTGTFTDSVTSTNVNASRATFSGDVTARDFVSLSDVALKDNVETISNPLGVLSSVRGVSFDWKDGYGSSIGVIAQEVEAVLPQLVTSNQNKSVNYNGLIGILVEAVKQLSQEVNELKNK